MSNLGPGFPRWGPSNVAGTLLDRRIGQVAADWRDSCVGDAVDTDRIVRVVAEALHGCGGNTARGHVHPAADDLYEANRKHLATLDPRQIACLREVLRRQVLLELAPAEALVALHCVSGVVDELQRKVAAWGVDRLERLAYVDELTGLGNRRASGEAINRLMATAVRHERPLVAVVVDLDHLKGINDRDGHAAGDAALRSLGDAFRAGLREGDVAFRTGGDEFLVLLPETSLDAAEGVVGRIRDAGAPAFSYGIAEAPREAATVADLQRIADQRLLEGRRETRRPARSTRALEGVRRTVPVTGGHLLLIAGALALVVWGILATVDGDAALGVFGIGIFAGMIAAAVAPTRPRRPMLAASVLAPLAGMVAATVAAPLVSADRRPATRIEQAAESLTATSATVGGVALAEVVPTGTTTPGQLAPAPPTPLPPWVAGGAAAGVARPFPVLPGRAETLATTPTTTSTSTSTTSTTSTSTTSTTAPTEPGAPTGAARADSGGSTAAAGPTAVDDEVAVTLEENEVTVLGNDVPSDWPIVNATVSVVRVPTTGTVTVTEKGTLLLRGGEIGRDTFEYQVCDTHGRCGRALVTVERRSSL